MVNAAQAEDSSDVIMGNLPVNDVPAKVPFDTGASHCFMSKPFFAKNEFVSSHLGKQMDIVSPGKRLSASLEVLMMSLSRWATTSFFLLRWFLVIRILILFSEWIGFLSTRRSLIVQPGRFN